MSAVIAIWVYGALCLLVGAWLGWLQGQMRGDRAEARAQGLMIRAKRRHAHALKLLLQAKILMGAPTAQEKQQEPEDSADWWKRN